MRACRGGQVRILEQEVALGPADVDLVAEQVVGDAVRPVAVDDDQAKAGLLARHHPDRGGQRRLHGRRSMGAGAGAACAGMLPAWALCSISRSVERLDAGCRSAATDTTSGNRCSTSRVPQYWQNSTSPAFRFPQRPHLIMWKVFASSGIL